MDNWNPILKAITLSDNDAKEIQDKQFELQCKADYRESQKRNMYNQENQYKAYRLIWERFATAMKARIKACKYFEDDIYNDPVKLLRAIKQHTLNYQESRYEMSVISDEFNTFFVTRQKDHENLQDHTRILKMPYEVLQLHIGSPIQLQKFLKTLNGFTDDPDNKDDFLMN